MKKDYLDKIRSSVKNFEDMGDSELKDLQQSSLFSEKEFVAYVLKESGVKYKEVAKLLEVKEGTASGKVDRARKKVESAEKTILVSSVFN